MEDMERLRAKFSQHELEEMSNGELDLALRLSKLEETAELEAKAKLAAKVRQDEEEHFAEAMWEAAQGNNPERISRDQMFFEVAHVLRKRSTCLRGKVGCVIVRDRRIVSQGYNGAPPNMPHCFELGCDVDQNNHEAGCQRTVHAEANAIVFAAKHGVPVDGADLWCTHGPCLKCAQLIITAGIASVHYITPYRLEGGLDLLAQAGMHVTQHAF